MSSSNQSITIDELCEVKIDTSSLVPSWTSPYNTECPCCLEIPPQGRVILDCKHLLCITCFIKHIQNSKECPVCRTNIHNIAFPSRSNQLSVIGQTIMNREINRRLQHHIDEVNNIRQSLPRPPQPIINQLRNAPPLSAQRNTNNVQTRPRRPIFENDNFVLDEEDIEPIAPRQYITITIFTIVDILIMLLWLHAINSKHKNN